MQQELFIKMALDAWNAQIKFTNDFLSELSDEQLMKEVSPGRNRGLYLVGHLAAVHDRMFPVLDIGKEIKPEMFEIFVSKPDKAVSDLPSIDETKNYWKTVNEKLKEQFDKLTPEQWFQRHMSVSEEDFKKEPHRNRLNLVISRTNHLASHLGQLRFLKPSVQD
jgi:hypothetical protein